VNPEAEKGKAAVGRIGFAEKKGYNPRVKE